MSFVVFGSNNLPLYRPFAWKNYVLDHLLRKSFSSNGCSVRSPSNCVSMKLQSLKTLVQCPFSGERVFAGLQPALSIE
jgi:hypothetical protein